MITYKVSNLSNINQYLELYKRCFKNFGKNFNYLNWLYKKNPLGDYVGIDAFHNNNLIGQIGGIPYNFKFKNNILKTLVSINICVDENYRGKKIFLNLSKKLEIHLRKKNYELLIAIGNIQATPAWIKSIQMKYLCHLDAFIGFKDFSKIQISIKDYNLFVDWDHQMINWRCSNPLNETKMIKQNSRGLILSNTKIPFTKVYAPHPFKAKSQFLKNIKDNNNLKMFIGLSNEINDSFFFRKIPEYLKPSPLNFLYKFLNQNYDLKKEEVFLTYLDFDAF